jgi:SAM-dependent methyltransferase
MLPGMPDGSWEQRADQLAKQAVAEGRATEWFDRLYAEATAGKVDMPWDRREPAALLREWMTARWPGDRGGSSGRDRASGRGGAGPALVIGCGLGADAEPIAALGFATTAFDISPTAIAQARRRNPGSAVSYRVEDVLALPAEFSRAFDLVIEIHTIQALPRSMRPRVVAAVANTVAPGGTALVIGAAYGTIPDGDAGPPWPIVRSELDGFVDAGLKEVAVEAVGDLSAGSVARWRAEFRRPRTAVGSSAGAE